METEQIRKTMQHTIKKAKDRTTGTVVSLIRRGVKRLRRSPSVVAVYTHSFVTCVARRRHSTTSRPAFSQAAQTASKRSAGGMPINARCRGSVTRLRSTYTSNT